MGCCRCGEVCREEEENILQFPIMEFTPPVPLRGTDFFQAITQKTNIIYPLVGIASASIIAMFMR